MIYVSLVATAPACQGRGYASALLEAVCAQVSVNTLLLHNLIEILESTLFNLRHHRQTDRVGRCI